MIYLKTVSVHVGRVVFGIPTLAALGSLRVLHVSGNKLRFLPANIGNASKLEEVCANLLLVIQFANRRSKLYVRENRLRDIPATVSELKNLKELHLDGNKLTHLPPDIGAMMIFR